MRETDKKFDIVIVDSSDPVGPSITLHEEGFYKEIKKILNPEVIVVSQAGSPFYHLESIVKKDIFLRKQFEFVSFYSVPVPTYPGGSWCFAFLSDQIDPLAVKRNSPLGLKYFTLEIHKAAFALPAFIKAIIDKT